MDSLNVEFKRRLVAAQADADAQRGHQRLSVAGNQLGAATANREVKVQDDCLMAMIIDNTRAMV